MIQTQSKGALKRTEIAQAAISIIASEGIEALTFEAVGKAIGTRKSHVAYYFPDKKDIISASIELIVGLGLRVIEEYMERNNSTLKSYAEANILWLDTYPKHAPVFMFFLYMATFNEKYQALFEQIRANGQDRIKLMILNEGYEVPRDKISDLSVAVQNLISSTLIEIHATRGDKKKIKKSLWLQIEDQIKGCRVKQLT